MQYLIGLDIGTTAEKAALYDTNGVMLASATREYPLQHAEGQLCGSACADVLGRVPCLRAGTQFTVSISNAPKCLSAEPKPVCHDSFRIFLLAPLACISFHAAVASSLRLKCSICYPP